MKKSVIYLAQLVLLISCSLSAKHIKVIVASENKQKVQAVHDAFVTRFATECCCEPITFEFIPKKTSSRIPEQPVGQNVAELGARNRATGLDSADYVVSIENYIEFSHQTNSWHDIGLILVKNLVNNEEAIALTQSVVVPEEYVFKAQDMSKDMGGIMADGYPVTVGQVIKESFIAKAIDAHDWHKEPEFGGVSRQQLLHDAVIKALNYKEIAFLKTFLGVYKDFPKAGITFFDFLPIFTDPRAFEMCIGLLGEYYQSKNISVVVGLESRGFIIGTALAYRLGVPFVPVRKPGKTPGATYSVSYQKEYGPDTLVISQTALQPDQRVLIVDDLIATGGSARAAIELVKLTGAEPVGFVSLLQIKELAGKAQLGIPAFCLID